MSQSRIFTSTVQLEALLSLLDENGRFDALLGRFEKAFSSKQVHEVRPSGVWFSP